MISYTVIDFESNPGWGVLLRRGLKDLVEGFRHRETWSFLAWHEIRKQYQRSVLGPFWLTLNMAILVGTLGLFYSEIFGQEIDSFLPYVTLGFVVFGLISGIITEMCTVFIGAAASIKQSQIALSLYVYKVVWKQIIMFLHNLTIYLLVWMIFVIPLGPQAFLAIPGLALIILSGFFVGLILGTIAARFRDIPPIVASVMQVFFFLTPVFWTAESLSSRAAFVQVNPFYHYLELVRRPLLGGVPSDLNWMVAAGMTVVLAISGVIFFSRYRSQLAFWV